MVQVSIAIIREFTLENLVFTNVTDIILSEKLQMVIKFVIFVNRNNKMMNERIKKIIAYYNLSATQFATEIGIQRSALSHIMSGRNKPSLDFMIKLKTRFNEINSDWLLFGKGKMIASEINESNNASHDGRILFHDIKDTLEDEKSMVRPEEADTYAIKSEKEKIAAKKESLKSVDKRDLEIEKIVIFYKNGRFKSYKPD